MGKRLQSIGAILSLVALLHGQVLLRVFNGLGVNGAPTTLPLKGMRPSTMGTVIAFSNQNDIYPDGEHNTEVVLERGHSVIYGCSTANMAKMGDVTMFPSKPQRHTLANVSGVSDEERLKKSIPHQLVYRSDVSLVRRLQDKYNGDQLVIHYPKDAIIMAKDPRNFSLNFACKWTPKDGKGGEIYKWFKVTFTDVYPMAYGCETGLNQLFMNTPPLTSLNYVKIQNHMHCYVDPKPGMVIGIYCQPGERIFPSNCLTKFVSNTDHKVLKFDERFFDPTFDYNSRSDRLKLFRVPDEGINTNVKFGCSCQDQSNIMKKMLIVSNWRDEEINIARMVRLGNITRRSGLRKYPQMMYPGKSLKIVINAKRNVTLTDGQIGVTELIPANAETHALIRTDSNQEEVVTPLNALLASRGFKVEKHEKNKMIEYTFKSDPNAIFVLKKAAASVTYKWKMGRQFDTNSSRTLLDIEIAFVPTDPYTYGCGVQSRDLFHKDATVITDLDKGTNHEFTECLVNAHEVSPIGFYCPKGYRLEPPDCFNHMIMRGSDEVVSISEFMPHARAIPGINIQVLDTNVPKSKEGPVKYSDDVLICKCFDQGDIMRSVIQLQLHKPNE